MNQGFSLTEVLVSLVLITGTSLALIKQQWQVSQLFNQTHFRTETQSQLDNSIECLYSETKNNMARYIFTQKKSAP